MADLVANIAKGRVIELYNRVKSNDPTNSALVIVVIDAGAVTDDQLRDYDDLATMLGAVTERNTNNWARKVLTDADLAALPSPDDTNNWFQIDIPDQTWTAVGAGGGASTDLVICYDADTTGGTDANILPLTIHDFAVTPDGSDITAQIDANGFFRAS